MDMDATAVSDACFAALGVAGLRGGVEECKDAKAGKDVTLVCKARVHRVMLPSRSHGGRWLSRTAHHEGRL